MFSQRLNEVQVRLTIVPQGPLLIKDGRHHPDGDRRRRSFHPDVTRNPARPRRREGHGYGDYDSDTLCFDMACVWTRTAGVARYYLPGSSLRGLLRVTAERIVARWNPAWARAADPFCCASESWVNDKREHEHSPAGSAIYAKAGPIERCFGHTALRGRLTIQDAYLSHEHDAAPIVRDGVGIDRRTGAAVENIKFQFEAITGGRFTTTLSLVNYEHWQLGLLAHMLTDLDAGAIRVGYATRRGLGRVRVIVDELQFRWFGPAVTGELAQPGVPGLATLATRAGMPEIERYALRDAPSQALQFAASNSEPERSPLGVTLRIQPPQSDDSADQFTGTDWNAPLWSAMADNLPAVLSEWPFPDDLRAPKRETEEAL
jgi:CRISPR/Cas system CSM-associated protein Csm3 (group 7 of RAMP superfamily)